MKGFFGVGVENISKSLNLGNLVRSSHAFGASFFFTLNAQYSLKQLNKADTTKASQNLPFYDFSSFDDMLLPKHCQLVGVELTEDAIELPSFRHPRCAAYLLGPERGSLSEHSLSYCDHVIKIPTQFCINVAVAGALVLYDRIQSTNHFPDRPVSAGGPCSFDKEHNFGMPVWHKKQKRREQFEQEKEK